MLCAQTIILSVQTIQFDMTAQALCKLFNVLCKSVNTMRANRLMVCVQNTPWSTFQKLKLNEALLSYMHEEF